MLLKERMIIMMNLDTNNKEGMVIPVSDTVLLPGMIHTLRLSKMSEEELENLAKEHKFNIALSLKQNFNKNQLTEEDFYRVGVSFEVSEIEKTEKGHQVRIKVLDRVEVKALSIGNDSISVGFEIASDVIDLTEKSQEEMVEYVKKVTREVSEN